MVAGHRLGLGEGEEEEEEGVLHSMVAEDKDCSKAGVQVLALARA